ncbi:MAG: hypothetical protein CMH60_07690 [Myxococcales bacterium]|nr:hypothetical protein [Myxococcales bacterium]
MLVACSKCSQPIFVRSSALIDERNAIPCKACDADTFVDLDGGVINQHVAAADGEELGEDATDGASPDVSSANGSDIQEEAERDEASESEVEAAAEEELGSSQESQEESAVHAEPPPAAIAASLAETADAGESGEDSAGEHSLEPNMQGLEDVAHDDEDEHAHEVLAEENEEGSPEDSESLAAGDINTAPPPADPEGRDILDEAKERYRQQQEPDANSSQAGAGVKSAQGGPNKWSKVSQGDNVFGRTRSGFDVESRPPTPVKQVPRPTRSVHIRPKADRRPFLFGGAALLLVLVVVMNLGGEEAEAEQEATSVATAAVEAASENNGASNKQAAPADGAEALANKAKVDAVPVELDENDSKPQNSDVKTVSVVDQDKARSHYLAANQFLNENRVKEAIASLEMAIAENPHYGLAFRSLGIAYMREGNIEQAVSFYKRFVELEPEHVDTAQVKKVIAKYTE